VSECPAETTVTAACKCGRWRRRLRRTALATLVLFLVVGYAVKDHVRTLCSVRRIPGTHAFVMDYYVDYHIDKIRAHGMDVHNIEDSYVGTLLPDFVVPMAARLKRVYLQRKIEIVEEKGDHCSTVALRSNNGDVFFGRNLDYSNDACLILRVHDHCGLASLAVIDLAYFNLNRADLDRTSLLERLPLLCAPYYAMDGMNRHGVAVSNMSVHPARAPVNPANPEIILSTLERVILDYAKTADEAVDLVRAFNVHFAVTTEHLMVADASGRSRIIEFIGGEMRVTPGEGSWQICTNDIVWGRSEAQRRSACRRYQTGSDAAEKLGGVFDFAAARDVIRSMSVKRWTMWTSVYNLTAGEAGVMYRARPDVEYRDAIPRANRDKR
jgi:hypothetical protein